MGYENIRKELQDFYWDNYRIEPAKAFADKVFAILDEKVTPDMSVTQQKLLQQQVILDEFQPVHQPSSVP